MCVCVCVRKIDREREWVNVHVSVRQGGLLKTFSFPQQRQEIPSRFVRFSRSLSLSLSVSLSFCLPPPPFFLAFTFGRHDREQTVPGAGRHLRCIFFPPLDIKVLHRNQNLINHPPSLTEFISRGGFDSGRSSPTDRAGAPAIRCEIKYS